MNANKDEDVRIQICWICQIDIFEFQCICLSKNTNQL